MYAPLKCNQLQHTASCCSWVSKIPKMTLIQKLARQRGLATSPDSMNQYSHMDFHKLHSVASADTPCEERGKEAEGMLHCGVGP